MDTTQVSVFCVKFPRSFRNHISFRHPNQDSTAWIMESWTRMEQSNHWRQGKSHQELVTENGTVWYGSGKHVGRWYSSWRRYGTSYFLGRIIGTSSSNSIYQDNQKPRNRSSFFYGKNKSGTLTSNNNSEIRTASSTLCSKNLRKQSRTKSISSLIKFSLEWQQDSSQLDKKFQIEDQDVHQKPNLTGTNQWNYVNSKHNPADQGTRGLTATNMTEKSLWLQGLQFLLSSSDNWKIDKQHEKGFLSSAEQKPQGTRRQPINKDLFDANRFSHWLKLRSVIIKMKSLRNKTRTGDQKIIDADNFFRLSQQQ